MKIIKKVVENDLCTSCGTCAGICPQNAIKMIIKKGIYVPSIDVKSCNNCGLCDLVCPGITIDLNKLRYSFDETKYYDKSEKMVKVAEYYLLF